MRMQLAHPLFTCIRRPNTNCTFYFVIPAMAKIASRKMTRRKGKKTEVIHLYYLLITFKILQEVFHRDNNCRGSCDRCIDYNCWIFFPAESRYSVLCWGCPSSLPQVAPQQYRDYLLPRYFQNTWAAHLFLIIGEFSVFSQHLQRDCCCFWVCRYLWMPECTLVKFSLAKTRMLCCAIDTVVSEFDCYAMLFLVMLTFRLPKMCCIKKKPSLASIFLYMFSLTPCIVWQEFEQKTIYHLEKTSKKGRVSNRTIKGC